MTGTVLNALPMLTHVLLTSTPGHRYYHYPHFIVEETNTQGSQVTCPRLHGEHVRQRNLFVQLVSKIQVLKTKLHICC